MLFCYCKTTRYFFMTIFMVCVFKYSVIKYSITISIIDRLYRNIRLYRLIDRETYRKQSHVREKRREKILKSNNATSLPLLAGFHRLPSFALSSIFLSASLSFSRAFSSLFFSRSRGSRPPLKYLFKPARSTRTRAGREINNEELNIQ